ncbi:hypothetical protein BJ165DRAFT_1408635 [Panaeolus papilionaceus]|nr:hypothetical protein BJ165DRAFT_1408635 [Panaeolus papilionaceus]
MQDLNRRKQTALKSIISDLVSKLCVFEKGHTFASTIHWALNDSTKEESESLSVCMHRRGYKEPIWWKDFGWSKSVNISVRVKASLRVDELKKSKTHLKHIVAAISNVWVGSGVLCSAVAKGTPYGVSPLGLLQIGNILDPWHTLPVYLRVFRAKQVQECPKRTIFGQDMLKIRKALYFEHNSGLFWALLGLF